MPEPVLYLFAALGVLVVIVIVASVVFGAYRPRPPDTEPDPGEGQHDLG